MNYIQSPQLTEQEIEVLLKEANTARICSLNPDGTIHAAPVNFRYENGRIHFVTPKASRKALNLKRNNSVTVLVDAEGGNLSDFKGVMIVGKADVKEGTLSDMLFISETWMQGDRVEEYTRRLFELSNWASIIVEPIRTASWDYSKDEEFSAIFQD